MNLSHPFLARFPKQNMKTIEIIRNWIIVFWVFIPFVHLPVVILQLIQHVSRPSSFTGNPILLAGESIFSMFLAYYMYQKQKDLIFLASSIISFFFIIITVTHAAYLALIITFVVTLWHFYD